MRCKMTRVRNFLCVVLTLIIACLCTVVALPASAEEINVADMKEYLREIDIPEEFLDTIDETGVQDMYYKLHNHNVSVDVYQTTTLPAEGVKNTRAGISEDALKFSMVVTSIFPDDEGTQPLKYVGIFVSYQWLQRPADYKTDGIIISWDSDVFVYQTNSFGSYSLSEYAENNVVKDSVSFTGERPNLISLNSLGYDVPLSKVHGKLPTALNGYASINLLPTHNPLYRGGSNKTIFIAQYSHLYNKYQAQVGFTFTYNGYVEPTVTFLVTEDTSTAAISTNYSYRYDN